MEDTAPQLPIDEARQAIAELAAQGVRNGSLTEDSRAIIATLSAQVTRLIDENEGLYQRIGKLEAENRDLQDYCDAESEFWDARVAAVEEETAFWDEWGTWASQLAARSLEVEARAAMLSRRRGTGIGRGRPAEWSEEDAARVRALRAAGLSFRGIADETRMTLGKVQRILAPRTRPPVTHAVQEQRLAQVAIDTRRFIAAVEQQRKREIRRAAKAKTNRGKS
jgi:hypothetical protein